MDEVQLDQGWKLYPVNDATLTAIKGIFTVRSQGGWRGGWGGGGGGWGGVWGGGVGGWVYGLSFRVGIFTVRSPKELGKGRDAMAYDRAYSNLAVHCAWRLQHDSWNKYAAERNDVRRHMNQIRNSGCQGRVRTLNPKP